MRGGEEPCGQIEIGICQQRTIAILRTRLAREIDKGAVLCGNTKNYCNELKNLKLGCEIR
jgi:hypothetical protein